MTDKIEFIESEGNLFEDVGFEKQEARKLQFKSYLMTSLIKYVKSRGFTQVEAAHKLGVTPSRMSNLMNYRIDLFSAEMLLDMMERVGFGIYEKIEMGIDHYLMHPLGSKKLKHHTKHAH